MACVVKTIRPSLAPNPQFTRLFMREARICARLRHQNIVQVIDFGRDDDGRLYLAMEYVDGRNLQEVFEGCAARGERLQSTEVLRVIVEVLKGLTQAHECTDEDGRPLGIVHRDLTPNNILISTAGEVKITDFGIAKIAVEETVSTDELRGKFHYMSPEQIEGKGVDGRSDLFTVGIVLYEALTGCKPFEGDSVRSLLAAITRGQVRQVDELDKLPQPARSFLLRALQRDPRARFPSASQMLSGAEELLRSIGPGDSNTLPKMIRRLFPGQGPADSAPRSIHERGTVTGIKGKGFPGKKKSRTLRWSAMWAILVACLVGVVFIWPPGRPGRPTLDESVDPTTLSPAMAAPIAKDTVAVLPNRFKPAPPVDGTPRTTDSKQAAPQPSTKPGALLVGDLMPYARVFINGAYQDDTPTSKITLSPGVYDLTLSNPNHGKSVKMKIEIAPEKTSFIAAWPEAM